MHFFSQQVSLICSSGHAERVVEDTGRKQLAQTPKKTMFQVVPPIFLQSVRLDGFKAFLTANLETFLLEVQKLQKQGFLPLSFLPNVLLDTFNAFKTARGKINSHIFEKKNTLGFFPSAGLKP